jgi:hypothetical protein
MAENTTKRIFRPVEMTGLVWSDGVLSRIVMIPNDAQSPLRPRAWPSHAFERARAQILLQTARADLSIRSAFCLCSHMNDKPAPTNDNRPTARFLPILGVVGRNGVVRFHAAMASAAKADPRFPNDPRVT